MKAWTSFVLAGFWLGCGDDPPAPIPRPELGADVLEIERCLHCHEDIRDRWEKLSSHGLLFDCRTCHDPVRTPEVAGHATIPECAQCHSELGHRGFACVRCHDPHGTDNLYVVRTEIDASTGTKADIVFRSAEGASDQGLVRTSSSAARGTGLCETCHTATRVYRASGDGNRHQTAFCPTCHLHSNGFGIPR